METIIRYYTSLQNNEMQNCNKLKINAAASKQKVKVK